MQVIYVASFAVGVIMLILFIAGIELDADHDGFMLLRPVAVAGGAVAFGATGLVCEYMSLPILSIAPAIGAGVIGYGFGWQLKNIMKRGEHNSHAENHVDFFARVSLDVEPGGFTEVKSPEHGVTRVKNGWTHALEKGREVVVRKNDDGEGLVIFPIES